MENQLYNNEQNQQEIFYDEKLGEIKLFKLKKEAYNCYIKSVRDSNNVSYYQARLKLNRNILAGKKTNIVHKQITYYYGKLVIVVVNDEIVWVKNDKQRIYSGYIDFEVRDRLTKLFKIEDDKNKLESEKQNKKVVLLDCDLSNSSKNKDKNKSFIHSIADKFINFKKSFI